MACSTTAVHSTVNRRVGGSNPPMPAKRDILQGGEAVCKIVAYGMVGSIPTSRTQHNMPPSSSGQGFQIFTLVARVRIPLGVQLSTKEKSYMNIVDSIPRSSNGKTRGSGPWNWGSNPWRGAVVEWLQYDY